MAWHGMAWHRIAAFYHYHIRYWYGVGIGKILALVWYWHDILALYLFTLLYQRPKPNSSESFVQWISPLHSLPSKGRLCHLTHLILNSVYRACSLSATRGAVRRVVGTEQWFLSTFPTWAFWAQTFRTFFRHSSGQHAKPKDQKTKGPKDQKTKRPKPSFRSIVYLVCAWVSGPFRSFPLALFFPQVENIQNLNIPRQRSRTLKTRGGH